MKQHLEYLLSLTDIKDIYNYLNQDIEYFGGTNEKGKIFELYLIEILKKSGFEAKFKGGSNDRGIDIEVWGNNSEKPDYVIQAKNWLTKISIDMVKSEFTKSKDLIDYKNNDIKYKIVSLNGFTKEAIDYTHNIIHTLNGMNFIEQILNTSNRVLNPDFDVDLYPHNQDTYNNMLEILEQHNRTIAIQPTGTGKMYLMAKLLFKAIRENEKAIVVAPTNIILDKIQEEFPFLNKHQNIIFTTYDGLGKYTENSEEFKYVLLDEVHRTGAETWGKNVDKLINENHKLATFTATPQRTDDIDIFEMLKLTEENIAVNMTLFDAISQEILKEPKYITALYNYDEDIENEKQNIKNNDKIKEEDKKRFIKELEKIQLDWRSSNGISEILKKHLTGSENKFVVFHKDINNLKKSQSKVTEWFELAGYDSDYINKYSVHSEKNKNENLLNIKNFETEKKYKNGMDLLHSVNMVNEGYHLKGLNGAIFLRDTESSIIYYQQMGRPMGSGKKDNPIIFDFVNNIKNAENGINFKLELEKSSKKFNKRLNEFKIKEKETIKNVQIFDYIIEPMRILEEFKFQYSNEYYIEEYINHFKKNGSIKRRNITKLENYLYFWHETQIKLFKNNKLKLSNKEINRLLEVDKNFFKTYDEILILNLNNLLKKYIKFIINNNKKPEENGKLKNEKELFKWKIVQKRYKKENRSKLTKEQEEILLNYDNTFFYTDEERIIKENKNYIEMYNDFIITNNKIPNYKGNLDNELELYLWKKRTKRYNQLNLSYLTEEQIKLLEKYDKDFFKSRIEIEEEKITNNIKNFIKFITDNNKIPEINGKLKNEKELFKWKNQQKQYLIQNRSKLTEEQIKLLEKYDKDFFKTQENLNNMINKYIKFYLKHQKEPKRKENNSEETKLNRFISNLKININKNNNYLSIEQLQKLLKVNPNFLNNELLKKINIKKEKIIEENSSLNIGF